MSIVGMILEADRVGCRYCRGNIREFSLNMVQCRKHGRRMIRTESRCEKFQRALPVAELHDLFISTNCRVRIPGFILNQTDVEKCQLISAEDLHQILNIAATYGNVVISMKHV